MQNLVLLPINATQVVEEEEREGEEKSLATCGALLESAAEFAGVFAVPDCLSVCVSVCVGMYMHSFSAQNATRCKIE